MDFNIQWDELGLRSCGKHLLREGVEHTTAEIIKWQGDTCFVLAYWVKDSEGYDLKFVGSRPFNEDRDTFWLLAKQGQRMLDIHFEELEREDV